MFGEAKTVLIVDDDESAREFVQAVMESEGWQTFEARNGLEGFDLAVEKQPLLIILDVEMPEKDGFETFRDLRADGRTGHIPIIMLTAINQAQFGERHDEDTMAARFGVQRPEAFVDKPVDPSFLMDAIFGVVG